MRIGLLSFAAPPASGGGAVYVNLLARAVADTGEHELAVFAERLASDEQESFLGAEVTVHRIFSRRATAQERDVRSVVSFGFQQIQMVRLAAMLPRLKLDALLIHAGVLRHPTPISVLVAAARRCNTAIVLDVRDVAYPESRASYLPKFDSVIACAEAPRAHIEEISGGSVRPLVVPVIFESEAPTAADLQEANQHLQRLGLSDNDRYVMMSGGLTYAKGGSVAAAVALELASSGIPIVSCGPIRLKSAVIDQARDSGALLYAGRVSHGAHTAMLERASCLASFSVQEGLPRTFLEAITMRKSLFAPTVVPEFSHLPQLEGTAQEKASQIAEAVHRGDPNEAYAYDIAQHAPEAVLTKLTDHLSELSPSGPARSKSR